MRVAHYIPRDTPEQASPFLEALLRYRSTRFADQLVVCDAETPLARRLAELGASVRVTADERDACRQLREADVVGLHADRADALPAALLRRFARPRIVSTSRAGSFELGRWDRGVALSLTALKAQSDPSRWSLIRPGIDLEQHPCVDRKAIQGRVITRVYRSYHNDEFCWYALLPILARRRDVEVWLTGTGGSSGERVRILDASVTLEEALASSYLCLYTPNPELKYDDGRRDSVLMKAMAMGTPCVVSDVPVVRDTVADPGAVAGVPFNDVASLTLTLETLLNNPDAAADLACRGRRFAVAELDVRRQVAEYEAVYQQVLRCA